MISELELRNIKCFRNKTIKIRPLTFLSGVNGMGKSTILQTLLLLRQSRGGEKFELNGELFKFGDVEDLYSESADEDFINISLSSDKNRYVWSNKVYRDTGGDLKTEPESWPTNTEFDESLFGDKFQFLSAERLGPRVLLPLNRESSDSLYLGKNGENLVSVLDALESQTLLNDNFPIHLKTKSRDIYAQINAWMNEISPASSFDVKAIKEADSGLYTFSYRSPLGKSRSFRPTNVGFGLSYTLPILIALLTAREGSITIIENPEAHLHPRAQMVVGQLLAHCANAGAQVIVESHSDHVMNGIRIAVKEKLIKNEDVALHFINRPDPLDITSTDILTPELSDNGKLSEWPDGFFDEWDNALDKLV